MRRSLIKTMMVAAVAIAAALVSAPGPASAVPADEPVTVQAGVFRIVSAVTGGHCLDSNHAGDVYVLPCSNTPNFFQDWELWFGGWAKNKQTGRCLTLRPGWYLGTDNCRWGDRYQEWKQWSGGWFQNHSDNACIDWHPGNGTFVKAEACIWDYVPQHWAERTPA